MSDDDEADSFIRELAASPPIAPPPIAKPGPRRARVSRRRVRLVLGFALVALLACVLFVLRSLHDRRSVHAVRLAGTPAAVDGVLDLSAYRLLGNPVHLDAQQWSSCIGIVSSPTIPERRDHPQTRRSPSIRGRAPSCEMGHARPRLVYATYQLRVLLPREVSNGETDLLQSAGCSTAGSLVLRDTSGTLLSKPGISVAGSRPEQSVPYDGDTTTRFRTRSNLLMTMYCSNWENANSGGPRAVVLGAAADIEALVAKQRTIDFFIIGVLVMIGLHHLLLFALRRRDRGPLWFGLLCFVLALRVLFVQRYVLNAFPDSRLWALSWRVSDFQTLYTGVPLFACFFRALFTRYASTHDARHRGGEHRVQHHSAGSSIRIVTSTLHVFQGFTIVCMAWVVVLTVMALLRNRDTLAGVLLSDSSRSPSSFFTISTSPIAAS